MSTQIIFHGVHAIRVDAYTVPAGYPGGADHHGQVLTLLDAHGWTVGEITLWLASPDAALPVGDRAQLDPAPAAEITDWPL